MAIVINFSNLNRALQERTIEMYQENELDIVSTITNGEIFIANNNVQTTNQERWGNVVEEFSFLRSPQAMEMSHSDFWTWYGNSMVT